jgi:hypothetical protein
MAVKDIRDPADSSAECEHRPAENGEAAMIVPIGVTAVIAVETRSLGKKRMVKEVDRYVRIREGGGQNPYALLTECDWDLQVRQQGLEDVGGNCSVQRHADPDVMVKLPKLLGKRADNIRQTSRFGEWY